ncbi:Multi antimicrobial extrusion protein, partial [Parasponia andersonii]
MRLEAQLYLVLGQIKKLLQKADAVYLPKSVLCSLLECKLVALPCIEKVISLFKVGSVSALDTLCGQLFGAKQYHKLGIQLQRAIIFNSACSVLIAIIWANITPIMIAMHQDHEISEEAGRYAELMIPSIFAFGLIQCFQSFLQNQNIVYAMVLSSAVSTPLHVLFCWILVHKTRLESRGAALATSLSYWSFKTWAFELLVILSGFLPDPKLGTSVQSICLNTFGLLWSIPAGLMASTSIRVANELGAKNLQAASLAMQVVSVMVIMEGLLVGISVILLRKTWGRLYSSDKKVVSTVASMMPFVAMSSFLNGFETVLSGIFRGCGWQKIGVYSNLAAFYVVGFLGLWLGIMAAFVMDIVFFLIIIIRTNWDKEVVKAENRVRKYTNPGELASNEGVSAANNRSGGAAYGIDAGKYARELMLNSAIAAARNSKGQADHDHDRDVDPKRVTRDREAFSGCAEVEGSSSV